MSDINQEDLKARAGVKNLNKSTPNAGRNYANRVNNLAKQRMEKVRRNVGRMDLIQAVSRLKISNLPLGLRSKLIQRVLYYRGNAMYYRDFDLERDFVLPYSLTSQDTQNIDFYGQYTVVKPMPFNGKSTDRRSQTGKEVYIGTITRFPVYDMEELKHFLSLTVEELEKRFNPPTDKQNKPKKGYRPTEAKTAKDWCQRNLCVIIRDYTQELSETNIPLSVAQQPFIDMQAETLPMLRTMMLKAAMPKVVKASDEGVVDSLLAELDAIESSIIEGKTMIPVTSFQDLQEIDSKDAGRVIEVMAMMYEGYGNIRKTFLGIPNDGAFKKNAHVLQDEQDKNGTSSDSILDDCLENYTESFDMVNELFDLDIIVELAGAVQQKQAAEELETEEKQAAKETGGEGGGSE